MKNPLRPDAWPAPLQARYEQVQERYRGLEPRERKMVLVAGFVIILMLLYLVVWDPASHALQANAAALKQARSTAAQIEQLAARAPKPAHHAATKAADKGRSLLSIVDQASRNIVDLPAPSRLQPDGNDKVRIWFKQAPFKSLVDWIQALHTTHGITVNNADITRGDKAGRVDARFSLEVGK